MNNGMFWRVTLVPLVSFILPWPSALAQPTGADAALPPYVDQTVNGSSMDSRVLLAFNEDRPPSSLPVTPGLPPTTRVPSDPPASHQVEVAPGATQPPGYFNEFGEFIKGGPHGGIYPNYACMDGGHCGWLLLFGCEETFLAPSRSGVDSSVTTYSAVNSFSASSESTMEFGPRVWLGVQHEKWQFLGQFWYLGGPENHVDPLMLGINDTGGLIHGRDIRAYTVDAEVRRLFCCAEDWDLYLGAGFRYASMENTAHVSATAMDDSGPLSAVVHADGFAYTRFYAPGITFTVGGDRPIHVFCCSQLDFVWNLRGSVVWGEIDSTAQTEAWVYDPSVPGVASHFDAASASTKNTLFIGGLQTGLRWMHELKCAPAVAFVQCMFEMQWWDADGGVAETQSEAVVQTTRSTAAAVSGPSVEATLVGLALGCGLTW